MPKRSTVTKAPPETLRAKANRIAIERDRLVAAGRKDDAVKLVAGLNSEIRAAKAKKVAVKKTASPRPIAKVAVAKKKAASTSIPAASPRPKFNPKAPLAPQEAALEQRSREASARSAALAAKSLRPTAQVAYTAKKKKSSTS